jgi:uncharacterized protein
MIDYFEIIHKYIAPDSLTYRFYVPHVSLVTAKALEVACRFDLSEEQLRFIEEAAMLHDIGIVRVNQAILGCEGDGPYIRHGIEGRKILEVEGLPEHALVAERHIGVGITKTEIIENNFPLPPRDMLPQSLEEKIISWADLFFGKKRPWQQKSREKIKKNLGKFGDAEEKVKIFEEWSKIFEG